MPAKIHKDMKKALAQAVNGVAAIATSMGVTLYLGIRTDTPADADTLTTISGNEIVGGSYARVAITRNNTNAPDAASGNDWLLSFLQQSFPQFTGTPTTNGGTHWFLTDQAAGYTGNLWASGPLQDAAVATTLQALANSAQAVISLTNAVAATLNPSDYLYIGTVVTAGTAGNQERGKILSIGAANSGGAGFTNVTLNANLASTHQSGEPVSRDCCTRTYQSGYTEKVTPSLLFQSA